MDFSTNTNTSQHQHRSAKPSTRNTVKNKKRAAPEAQRQACITSLRFTRTHSKPKCSEIADVLDGCTTRDPCHSAACSVCSKATQKRGLVQLTTAFSPDEDLVMITIIDARLQCDPGELPSIKLKSVRRHFQRLFTQALCSDIPLWGYIGVSYNEHIANEWKPRWAVELHGVVRANHAERLKAQLRPLLERTESVKRPLRCDPIRNWKRQTSYVSKPYVGRRVSYRSECGDKRTWKTALKATHLVEFLLWASDYQPDDRHFMMAIRRYGNRLNVLVPARLSSSQLAKRPQEAAWKPEEAHKTRR
jgi:hypothetical protein